MFRKTPLAKAVGFALAASTLGISPQVLGQEVDAEDESGAIEEIVTTGSRIKRDNFSSSAPVDVVLTESAALQGMADIGEMLRTTTIAAGSPQITSASSTAFVQNGGSGSSSLSLRGLGPNRTLTLLNGRRAGPAGTRGGVSAFDLNVIPLVAIERVEILKDGASSVYGSDAVAGVVNFITKKGDGLFVDGYQSSPEQSGGEVSALSASWGKSFSRGSFRLTGDYYVQQELVKGDRDYFACGEQGYTDPVTGQSANTIDPRTGSARCADLGWGHVWIYDYQGAGGNVPTRAKAQFDYDGDLANYIPPIGVDPNDPEFLAAVPGWFLVNYDVPSDGVYNAQHPFFDKESLIPKNERATFFGDFEFNITDRHTIYAEALLSKRETDIDSYRQYWSYIYSGNFDFGSLGTGVPGGGNPVSAAAGWNGGQWFSPTPITDHADSFIEVDYQRYVLGLRGDITQSWSYDIAYQYSHSDGSYTNDRIYNDSVVDQNWLSGSCVGTNTSIRGVPCIDIPWLDEELMRGNVSPEIDEFLFGRETGNTIYEQSSIEAFVTGDLFELPAGTMAAVLGIHYREDEIEDTPGLLTFNPSMPVGQQNNTWGSSSAGITAGKDKTQAIFGELDVPILADQPGFDSLSLSLSARYTDVDSYGSDSTYKVGLNWQISDSVRVRGSRGTSFRTPALFELFLADQTSFIRQSLIDPCIQWGAELAAANISQRVADNCAATTTPLNPGGLPSDYTGGTITAEAISGGGLGLLEAERSTSTTAGIIWTPEFAEFSLAIDYFSFDVEDQVDQLGAQSIVRGCYNSEFFPSDPLCQLYDRSGVNDGIDNVRDGFINVATQINRGWDLTARWILDAGPGTLQFDTQHTWQVEAATGLFDDTVRDNNGEFGNPKWVGNFRTLYSAGDWSFLWHVDMIGDVSNVEFFGGEQITYRGRDVNVELSGEAVAYHTFSLSKAFSNGFTVSGGMNNAFGQDPPQVSNVGGDNINTIGNSAFHTQYDWYGRRYWLRLQYSTDRF